MRKPVAPFRRPDYLDGNIWQSLFGTVADTTSSIFSSAQQTKQVQTQVNAQLEAARLAAQSGNPAVYADPSGNKNGMILIIVAVIVVLIIIGLVIWAVMRKK